MSHACRITRIPHRHKLYKFVYFMTDPHLYAPVSLEDISVISENRKTFLANSHKKKKNNSIDIRLQVTYVGKFNDTRHDIGVDRSNFLVS